MVCSWDPLLRRIRFVFLLSYRSLLQSDLVLNPNHTEFPRYLAVVDQLCSIQNGLGWHACTASCRCSPGNTKLFSCYFLSAGSLSAFASPISVRQGVHDRHLLEDNLDVVEVGSSASRSCSTCHQFFQWQKYHSISFDCSA